jgi:hypothetical protein
MCVKLLILAAEIFTFRKYSTKEKTDIHILSKQTVKVETVEFLVKNFMLPLHVSS